MKLPLLTVLLSTAALTMSVPAHADRTADILNSPSTSGKTPIVVSTSTATNDSVVAVTNIVIDETAEPEIPARFGPVEISAEKTVPVAALESKPTPVVMETVEKETTVTVFESVPQANNSTSMQEVLSRAYATNPTLRSERERLRIQYESVAQADARRRPKVDIEGGVGYSHSKSKPGAKSNSTPKDVSLVLVQPVWTGGRLSGYVDQQLILSDAAIASYEAIGSNVFFSIVSSAMDVMRDRATIDLQIKNRQVIAKQLDAAEKGFEVGNLTRTDVSQARARLSGADAAVSAAEAAYEGSLARYTQLTGMDARNIEFASHVSADMPIPTDLEAAQNIAASENPAIVAARYQQQAAKEGVELARSEMAPIVNVVGSAGNTWDPTKIVDRSENASIGVRASMNLYEGGATSSRIRQAKIGQYAQDDIYQEVARSVTHQVSAAWNDHLAARDQIKSFEAQIQAATIARDGVYKEQEVGLRTVLDALNAERELLDAQVGLVRVNRDAAVADYALLTAVGRLTPSRLDLFSVRQERKVLDTVRSDFGTDATPRN